MDLRIAMSVCLSVSKSVCRSTTLVQTDLNKYLMYCHKIHGTPLTWSFHQYHYDVDICGSG